MDGKTLGDLQHAIENKFDGSEALWKKTEHVHVPGGPSIEVAVFHFIDQRKVTVVCYAWPNPASDTRPHMVLHRGDVNDAETAVLSVLRAANRNSK